MAQIEPMDVDGSDFDDKENSLQNSNVFSNIPSTEKGYEELDVSEFNMKLRYSLTPASSPMSRSYTANSNYKGDSGQNSTVVLDNANLTRSLNSTVTKTDNIPKSPKIPLQSLPTGLFLNSEKNATTRELCQIEGNVTVSITGIDNDDNLSLPSTSSSMAHTPEATTPTKEIPKNDGGSPIMRGLKSVLNMFRSSQSPIPQSDLVVHDDLEAIEVQAKVEEQKDPLLLLSSTPIANSKIKESSSKRNSPLKDSVIFNDDLERELQWKDESTIFFKGETIPVHKLNFQSACSVALDTDKKLPIQTKAVEELDKPIKTTEVSYMDISYKSITEDKTDMTDIAVKTINNDVCGAESDSEFVDCEPMYTKSQSYILETVEDCSKFLPIVMQADNIAHEICLVDYIKPINNFDNTHTDTESIVLKSDRVNETVPVNIETNNCTSISSVECVDDVCNPPATSKFIITNDSCNLPLKDTNTPFPVMISEATNIDCVFSVDNQVKNTTNGINVSSIIVATNESHQVLELESVAVPDHIENELSPENIVEHNPTNITNDVPNDTEFTTSSSPSCIQVSVEENKILEMNIQSNNLTHEAYVQEANCLNKDSCSSEITMQTNVLNLLTNISGIKTEGSNKSVTDYNNDTQLLNQNGNVLLDSVTETNNEKDTVSGINEKALECIKESELLGLNIYAMENDLINQSVPLQNTVVSIKNKNIDENVIKSVEINDEYRIVQINGKTLASDENLASSSSCILKDYQVDILSSTNLLFDKSNTNKEDKSEFSTVNTSQNLVQTDEKFNSNVDAAICTDNIVNINESSTQDIKIKFKTDKITIHELDSEDVNLKISIDDNDIVNDSSFNIPDSEDKISKMDCDSNLNTGDNIKDNNFSQLENAGYHKYHKTNDISLDMNLHKLYDDLRQTRDIQYGEKKIDSDIALSEHFRSIELNNDLSSDIPLPNIYNIENDSSLHSCTTKNNNNEVCVSAISDIKTEAIKNENDPECIEIINQSKITNSLKDRNCLQAISLTNYVPSLQILSSRKVEAQEIASPKISGSSDHNDENITITAIVNHQTTNVDNDITKVLTLPDIVQAVNEIPEKQHLSTHMYESNIVYIESIESKDDDKPLTSPNNTYDLVTELDEHLSSNAQVQEIDSSAEIKNDKIDSLSLSPKCSTKGYNIDFDKIDNPFTTKTNLRMSPPPPETLLKKSFVSQNNQKTIDIQKKVQNRKSYLDSKKPIDTKKRFNTTVDKVMSNSKVKKSSIKIDATVPNENNKKNQSMNDSINSQMSASSDGNRQKEISLSMKNEVDCSYNLPEDINLPNIKEKIFNEYSKKHVSLDQFSISDSIKSRSVFNLGDIDDMNNTRKCLATPPLELNSLLNEENNSDIVAHQLTYETAYQTEPANVTEDYGQNEVKIESNISNVTSSSRSTDDRDVTVREIHTDDEDTIEGPFLEAEDFVEEGKVFHFEEDNDMMQFGDLPVTNKENVERDELFIDAETFEFLLNQNKDNVVADSGKESLFLKFDPLFAKRVSSDGVLAASSSIQKKQSTPKKLRLTPLINIPQGETTKVDPSSLTISMSDIGSSVSKPTMMVIPAVNSVVTPRGSVAKVNRRSFPSTSPAMVVIDKLLSLSGNGSLLDQDVALPHSNRHSDASIALTQLRELLAEKDVHVHQLICESKELKDRLSILESQVKCLENESEERIKKVNILNERLAEKTKINKSMAVVVEEYERTIACLITETEQERKRNAEEKMRLISERDEQTSHLACMEGSFSDLHNKYEKSKQILLTMKANADTYKKSFKEFEDNLLKMQKNYDSLKQHATSKLNHANMELDKMNRAHAVEVVKLTAMIKRKELHITSLEESLSQKTKANDELTAICEELINKVG